MTTHPLPQLLHDVVLPEDVFVHSFAHLGVKLRRRAAVRGAEGGVGGIWDLL